jgi:hypothetical protein
VEERKQISIARELSGQAGEGRWYIVEAVERSSFSMRRLMQEVIVGRNGLVVKPQTRVNLRVSRLSILF